MTIDTAALRELCKPEQKAPTGGAYVYYKNEWGELWHGDCLEVMDLLEIVGPMADMVLCDPPYGTTQNKWDAVVPLEKMWPRIWACTKSSAAVVLTAAQPFTSALGASQIDNLRYSWVWDKVRPVGHLNAKKRPMQRHEDVLVFGKKPPAYYPQGLVADRRVNRRSTSGENYGAAGLTNVSEFTNYPHSIVQFGTAQKGKIHPTQKPVALFAYLIRTYTNPGEVVLDFCAGSGTTAVAAGMTGRRWICIEKEEKYCELIAKRLSARRS